MKTKVFFKNPQGIINSAELDDEQIDKLRNTPGYKIVDDPNKPKPPKPRIHISDSACIACEG